jgi:Conjugative transfer region protein TrbK
LATKLAECRTVTHEQEDALSECRKVWTEKRRQFLGQKASSASSENGLLERAPIVRAAERREPPVYLVILRFSRPGKSDLWAALALSISSLRRSHGTPIPGLDYSEATSDISSPRWRRSASRWQAVLGMGRGRGHSGAARPEDPVCCVFAFITGFRSGLPTRSSCK